MDMQMTAWTRIHSAVAGSDTFSRRPPLGWLLAGCGGALFILAAAVSFGGLSYRELFNDPADTYGFSPVGGIVSTVGLMLWSAAVGTALATWESLRRRDGDLQLRRFFLATGLFTVLLLVDDAFMLHERVLPGLGFAERYVKATYLVLALAYGLGFRRELTRDGGLMLLVPTAAFFAASLVLDNPASIRAMGLLDAGFVSYVVEDGAKFVGIALWLTFVSRTAITVLASRRF
jgi:hypothetical protein